MKYASLLKKRPLIVVVVACLLGIAIALFCWPKLQVAYFSNRAQASFNSQLNALRPPLDILGFKGVAGGSAKCITEPVYSYSDPQLQCSVGRQAYVVIGKNKSEQTKYNSAAQELTHLLDVQGWTVSSNAAPTVGAWFHGITSRKDWYPDIAGFKNTSTSHCWFDISVAYSNPKPPAYAIQMTCSSPILAKLKNTI